MKSRGQKIENQNRSLLAIIKELPASALHITHHISLQNKRLKTPGMNDESSVTDICDVIPIEYITSFL